MGQISIKGNHLTHLEQLIEIKTLATAALLALEVHPQVYEHLV